MSVNLSPVQFRERGVELLIERVLAESSLDRGVARPRAHRERGDREQPDRDPEPAPPQSAGRQPVDRRFRHRLLVAVLHQAAAGAAAEDRPVLRAEPRAQPQRRGDRAGDHQSRPQPRPARDRRGGRDRGPAAAAARLRLRRGPGQPDQPAGERAAAGAAPRCDSLGSLRPRPRTAGALAAQARG